MRDAKTFTGAPIMGEEGTMRAQYSVGARLWAKKSISESGDMLWLPLVAHMADAAALAARLWDSEWLSRGVKKRIDVGITSKPDGEEGARRLFVFLAAAHDLGKAAPVFQSKKQVRTVRGVMSAPELDEFLHQGLRDAGLPG